ncbi:hypothetical protein M413DRAFT_200063 [Hebeloma cylindrosporum]|uniref:Uncharacterized protein n=1 Tax=Hebeloma cylindrosporum TaxID=76867 RepID=A0A0C3CTM3_HEBCY|nr:hypothetical protein M413DRAFT_200063 [Hebeloma cylindrosporum h7]
MLCLHTTTVSYLDLPDLALLARVAPCLVPLTTDAVLHTHRLRVVSPSRVNHYLFGRSPQGHALRPTVLDLVRRGVMRGLDLERRWRVGAYFYSLSAIRQYENGRSLSRRLASNVLSSQLRRRTAGVNAGASGTPISSSSSAISASLRTLYTAHVYPDVESSSLNVARSLLPTMRKLKWSLQRDRLAKVFKESGMRLGINAWLELGQGSGRRVVKETEKVRLAVCPDIRKTRGFFEGLGSAGR